MMNRYKIFGALLLLSFPATAATTGLDPTVAIQQDEHLDYWLRTLKTHPLKLVRKNAAKILGKMGNHEAVPALADALKDPFPGVRVEAARSLGLLGDERAFSALYDAISSEGDRELKKTASDAIEKIKARQEFQKQKEVKDQAAQEKLKAKSN